MVQTAIGFSVLAVGLAYMLGSLSFAVIVSRAMGLSDPRTYGSKNPGATNVLRSGSKVAAIVTLLLDALKGWLPVFLVREYGAGWGLGEVTLAGVALAAFMGHLFPVFFKFKGGKGVATAFGVWLGLNPILLLAAGATWLVIAQFFRYSSLASLVTAVFVPMYYVFGGDVAWGLSHSVALALIVMSALLVWRHQENIARLLQGTESKLGKKAR